MSKNKKEEIKVHNISNTRLFQLIDGEEKMVGNTKDVMKSWDILSKGNNYHTIGIIGCQSSGKSTILNLLFGTNFPVMDETQGLNQTTQGIWMGKSESSDTLVLDVEGTDSSERGEDHIKFERKSSLFCLAIAEILIVNLWETDIGRYDAANYGLLKTVFEVNLELFTTEQSRTLICFLVRDFTGTVEFPLLKKKILDNINLIWDQIQKPEQFKDSKIEQFFDLQFFNLVHKILQPKKFNKGVKQIKDFFLDKNNTFYLFKPEYHRQIPSDGLPDYLQNIWDTILTNKALDIPTQKEMLSLFRCDEIKNECFKEFETLLLERIVEPLQKDKILPELGRLMNKLFNEIIEEYKIPANRYVQEVSKQKQEELEEKMNEELFKQFTYQMKNVCKNFFKKFQKKFEKEFKDNEISLEFAKKINQLKMVIYEEFGNISNDSLLPNSSWDIEQFTLELENLIDNYIHEQKNQALKRIKKKLYDDYVNRITPELDNLLGFIENQIQFKVKGLFTSMTKYTIFEFEKYLKGMEATEEQMNDTINQFYEKAKQVVIDKFKENARFIGIHMKERFDEKFKYGENHTPRDFTIVSDLPQLFETATNEGINLLNLLKSIYLPKSLMNPEGRNNNLNLDEEEEVIENEENELEKEAEEDEEHVIIDDKEYEIQIKLYKKDIEMSYREAMSIQQSNKTSMKIPNFFWLLLLFFGRNDAIKIIRNPILFILLALLGVGGFFLHKFNLHLMFIKFIGPRTWNSIKAFMLGGKSSSSQAIVVPNTINKNKQDEKKEK
ncbi:protein sey1 [Anaeramoeba flamelloides]|uniref:Protein SEY1 homolog n=1 Tax=Anaeramoeba flamelloides TaxID=1746091 RepID=A0ABQ8X632_9EUKA|nr:protein sey1 [Anaeramoeba flamelloides]